MDVGIGLDEVIRYVRNARAMPMSASCVVNRVELLALLEDLRTTLPVDVAAAEDVLVEREELLAEARLAADRLVAQARAEQRRLVEEQAVLAEAREQAAAVVAAAEQEAAALRADVDDYVDRTLAHFEVALGGVLTSVRQGRGRLHGESAYDELAAEEPVAPPPRPRSGAPEVGAGQDRAAG